MLHHARHALAALEERASAGELQVDLFAAPAALETTASPVEAALAAIHPDQLSPREALDALYQLKAVMGKAAQRPAGKRRWTALYCVAPPRPTPAA